MSKKILRKYGESTIIPFTLFEIDGIDFKIDAVWALGDVKLLNDESGEANITVAFTDEGQGYSQALTAANMQFARGQLYIVDQGTKAWLDTGITIETYGHANSQHPNIGVAMRGTDNAALEVTLNAHEVARDAMESDLIDEHHTTQAEVGGITTEKVNILSATGYVKNIYWASGGKYFVKESEDIDIPFGFEGNPTGLDLWFVIGKDLKNAPLIKKELIEGVDWDVVDVDGVDTVEGIIPFAYADTDTLHGKYTAAAIVKTSATEAYTGWESLLIVDRPVARAEDLV